MDHTSMIEVSPMESDTSLLRSAFLIVNGANIYPITGAMVNIGRHPENNLVIEDPYISRNHAQLRLVRDQYVLFDLGSTSGTFVNGIKIKQHLLAPGDLILFAGIPVVFGLEAQQPPDQDQGLGNTAPMQTTAGCP
jgi:pSer/pThr/pTyr-binding forkhead associated (FHA) protein